jgi:hypothetical protein
MVAEAGAVLIVIGNALENNTDKNLFNSVGMAL